MLRCLMGVFILGLLSRPCSRPLFAEEPATSWKDQIQEVIDRPEYKQAHWGLLVADAESGEVLFEQDADKLFAPASVTKLFTVAAAWQQFGPEFRFVTPVYRVGSVENGRLNGHLVLVGSGDPTLGGRTNETGGISFRNDDHTYANGNDDAQLTDENPLAGLDELAKQVFESGIQHINGDVLVDGRMFDSAQSTGSGPSRLTPVMINDNVIDVVTTPGEAGAVAAVRWRPESSLITVDAQVTTAEPDSKVAIRAGWVGPGRVVVRGTIPEGHSPVVRILEWADSEAFARALFIESLRRAGIAVEASPLAAQNNGLLPPPGWYASAPRVAALQSPRFADEAKLILKVSHNLHASTLPLLLAVTRGQRTLNDGMRIEGEILEQLGVDRESISLSGGAGGERGDYVTPRATVQLLNTLFHRDDFETFRGTLPILGVDGTLAKVLDADSPAKGKVTAKTGTLHWDNALNNRELLTSKALAGYVDAASGRKLAFAVFVNLTHLQASSETTREGNALGRVAEILQQGL